MDSRGRLSLRENGEITAISVGRGLAPAVMFAVLKRYIRPLRHGIRRATSPMGRGYKWLALKENSCEAGERVMFHPRGLVVIL